MSAAFTRTLFSYVGFYFHQQSVLVVFIFECFIFIESSLYFITWYLDLQTYLKFHVLSLLFKKVFSVCLFGIYIFRCIFSCANYIYVRVNIFGQLCLRISGFT
jgi:hypothetical protein